jgi:hypothetical protein
MKADPIINAVLSVTKAWAKQRKAEERQASRALRRRETLVGRSGRTTIKDAAEEEMASAYAKASGDGFGPAHARQIMYAGRDAIQDATGETLDDKYFTQTLLPAYLRDYPDETADWDVVFDARGHIHEPHTDLIVPLGTLDVRAYLDGPNRDDDEEFPCPLFPTHGPRNRFNAILFIEKEGFWPLFKRLKLAERYDIAIMSTKGMSVVASRQLVDHLCGEHDIPLLVLHDFDKSGFSILGSLRRSNDRYRFRNRIKVVDLGLRLTDVQAMGLPSEYVSVSDSLKFRNNLLRNGATQAEIEFLAGRRRVELNSMTAPQLIKWIEGKLKKHGIKKLVPDDEVLEEAYRRALKHYHVQHRLCEIEDQEQALANAAKLPNSFAKKVKAALKANPALPWDVVVAAIAEEHSHV